MARRTTNKTGGSKQGAAQRRARASKASPAEATPDEIEAMTQDGAEATVALPEGDAAPASTVDAPVPGPAPDTSDPQPAAEDVAPVGEDTVAAPDSSDPSDAADDGATSEDAEVPSDMAAEPAITSDLPGASSVDASEGGDANANTAVGADALRPDAPDAQPAPVADTGSDPKAAAAAPAAAPAKRGGFVPMVLGGLIAGGLGYGAHLYQTSQQPAMTGDIDTLRAELNDLRGVMVTSADLSAVEAQIAALEPAGTPDFSALEGAIDDLRGQIAALPAPTDTTALQAQVDALLAQDPVDLGPLQDSLSALEAAYAPIPDQIAALQADMAELRALATQEVAEAEAAVDAARATAGFDRIRAALVTGAPFADAIEQLEQAGVAVPDALTALATRGVQTVEALQEDFTPAARAAVAASLEAAPAGSAAEKLGNFFRAQIGARSLAPRAGDDPDAIVARAGVAVADGELELARDELSSLPDAGREAMADWLDAVESRLNAVAALNAAQAEITTE